MVVLNQGHTKTVVGLAGAGYLPGLGRARLARELFRGRFRPRQSVQLLEIAAEYQLDHESVFKAFAEFQALGMVTLSGSLSAIVRSPEPQETREAYQIRAAIEEIAGRTAASVLKGYTAELRNQLSLMHAANADGDLDAFAEHDVEFHRNIVKASQNDVLLRVWEALAVDLRVRAVIGKISKYLPNVVESHQRIINAIETGRGEEAGLLLRSHVEASLAYLTGNESDLRFHGEPPRNLDLLDWHPAPPRSARSYRGGLGPARLRRVKELVHAKIEEELSIDEMAESAGLSTAHFSVMFRLSTGESPHQFVLRQRVERAKEMLRTPGMRILDVAIACGFKTQQHFARVFRRMCGASPTEYRYEFQ
jgi:DNA-binding GntR family transcriptional regulator/AraC-like DNA-binding protein